MFTSLLSQKLGISALILSSLALPLVSQARPQEGSYLGETRLSYAENDRDVIRLGNCPPNQPIDSIKVAAVRGTADIKLVRVRFENNQTEDLSVRSKINQGSQTSWIDLKGSNRCVKSVVIIGDTADYSRYPATLQVYGKRGTYQPQPQPRPQEGSYLGETQLSYAENDRDVIRLGNCPPNRLIRSIKVSAVRGTADIKLLRVRFGNNQIEDLSVRSKINQGSQTPWIDLKGSERCVTSIVVLGDTADYSRYPATLKVYGK